MRTAHAASGAVRTRMQGLWVALTTDDERAGSHRAWHDAIFSQSCRDSTFASHSHVLPEVCLPLAIVVVAIHAEKARQRVQKACVFEDVLGDIEYRKYKATFHGTPAGASQQPASAHSAPLGALPRRTGAPVASQPCRQQARRPALQGTDRTGTYSTEAAISPNKLYLLVRMHIVGIRGMCFHGFYFLFRKEPVAFSRLEALTDRFFVHFRHELPGPNVKTETQRPLNALY